MVASPSALLLLSALYAATSSSVTAGRVPTPHSSKPGSKHTVTDFLSFGDSYTDNCNSERLRASAEFIEKYPFPYCPPAPEGRASGGESWPEYIKIQQGQSVPTDKNVPIGKADHSRGQWNVVNLAQSAATCDNAVFNRSPVNDVGQQINLLKANYNTTAPMSHIQTDPETSWASIFIGTNDVSFYANTAEIPKETSCIERRLESLHDYGYRKFLLFENINLDYTPFYDGPEEGQQNKTMYSFTEGNRQAQTKLVEKLNRRWKGDGSEILVFPTYELFTRMYNKPQEYGFKTVKIPCVVTDNVGNALSTCADPENYLWFNDLHPSFNAEKILAAKVVKFLEQGKRGEDLLAGPN